MGKLTLLIGGARSGKSTCAEKLASERGNDILYIATAQALDPEMAARIEKHKGRRPQNWRALEIPHGIADALRDNTPPADLILLDCLTMLVSNLVLTVTDEEFEPDKGRAEEIVADEIESLLAIIKKSRVDWIIVSNEVGMGLVPAYPLGRVYRDLLGWANRKVAAAADEVYLLVAGLMLPLHQLASSSHSFV
ncbi:MAG: bifunctional adenosylcobinamide kinase/adenosylcobinamide-phosphate guanylyltransferase [Chloroflexi bacterium]|nr:bifunctional adenosylcobinamide kinase/adenosylcobinamide-phosphate guanylyltransferase [Chloroflexota bacterium]